MPKPSGQNQNGSMTRRGSSLIKTSQGHPHGLITDIFSPLSDSYYVPLIVVCFPFPSASNRTLAVPPERRGNHVSTYLLFKIDVSPFQYPNGEEPLEPFRLYSKLLAQTKQVLLMMTTSIGNQEARDRIANFIEASSTLRVHLWSAFGKLGERVLTVGGWNVAWVLKMLETDGSTSHLELGHSNFTFAGRHFPTLLVDGSFVLD